MFTCRGGITVTLILKNTSTDNSLLTENKGLLLVFGCYWSSPDQVDVHSCLEVILDNILQICTY